VLIEAVRLVVTLAFTAAGFILGSELPSRGVVVGAESDLAVVVGSLLGAGIGYVVGGVLGRLIRRSLDDAPNLVDRATGPQLFAGAFGLVAGMFVGAVVGVPLVVLLPPVVGWPLAALLVIVLGAGGSRVFAIRATDLLAAAGIKSVAPESGDVERFVIDSSAAIDGRVLDLARVGLVRGEMLVSESVIDELQGIADSGDRNRRRRGRRGLDVLEALREVPGVVLRADKRSFPMHPDVDAKLIALAEEADARLVTTDHNLSKAAGLRGIEVLDLQALGDVMRNGPVAGDMVRVRVEREGSEPGQGVGFLEDGTMVVIEGGAHAVDTEVEVEVASALRTSVGRMLFAKLGE
jgi:uncharacterized protein YacL